MENNTLTRQGTAKCSEYQRKLCTLRLKINERYHDVLQKERQINKPVLENLAVLDQLSDQMHIFDKQFTDVHNFVLRAELNPMPNIPPQKHRLFQNRVKSMGKRWFKFLKNYQMHEDECAQYAQQRKAFNNIMSSMYEISKRTSSLEDLEHLAEYFAMDRTAKPPILKAEELTHEWYSDELPLKMMEMLTEMKALFE